MSAKTILPRYRWACIAALYVSFCATGQLLQAADTTQDFTAEFPMPLETDRFAVGGSASVRADDGWDGNYMQLTPPVGSQQGTVFFDQVFGGAYDELLVTFQLRVDQGANGGADGFGFAYLDSSIHGTTGPSPTNPTFGEEPNLAGSLGIGFDTFNNGAGDANAEGSVSLHFNGGQIGDSVSLDGIFDLESGLVISAFMQVLPSPGEGGSRVSVILDDTFGGGTTFLPAFDNVLVSGMTAYDGRMAFGARTGGAWNRQAIDNVTADLLSGSIAQSYSEDFEVPATFDPFVVDGTPFTPKNHGSNPTLVPDDPSGTGVQPAFMRLTEEVAGHSSSIAFDQTSTATREILTSFDLSVTDTGLLSRADGMSMMLLDAADFGETGNSLPDGAQAFEEPNFAGALGVGFDTFSSGVGLPDFCADCVGNQGNAVSVHWDGAVVSEVTLALADIDLAAGVYHHADVFVQEGEQGGEGGSFVSVVLTDGTDGSVHVPIDSLFVPGVVFDGGARLAFGARTGGAADFHDIDNVNAQFVPEPSTWVLAALGVVGLGLVRRRRNA